MMEIHVFNKISERVVQPRSQILSKFIQTIDVLIFCIPLTVASPSKS